MPEKEPSGTMMIALHGAAAVVAVVCAAKNLKREFVQSKGKSRALPPLSMTISSMRGWKLPLLFRKRWRILTMKAHAAAVVAVAVRRQGKDVTFRKDVRKKGLGKAHLCASPARHAVVLLRVELAGGPI